MEYTLSKEQTRQSLNRRPASASVSAGMNQPSHVDPPLIGEPPSHTTEETHVFS